MDLIQAARSGDLNALQDCDVDALTTPDDEGITLLHWAAINNHRPVVSLLLDRGAPVDAVGGKLKASPLHWAVRQGHIGPTILLLDRGANPAHTDSQGFDALHLAVHAEAVYLVSLFASRMPPDVPDGEGRTALHWAAYQGHPTMVRILLAHSHRPDTADADGLTALHWAAVRGSVPVIRLLLVAGAEERTNSRQQTPYDLALSLNAQNPYKQARLAVARDRRRIANLRILFFAPFILLPVIPYLLVVLLGPFLGIPIYITVPLSCLAGAASHPLLHRLLLGHKPHIASSHQDEDMIRSPFLLGLVSSSVFWVAYVFLTRLVPSPYSVFSPIHALFIFFISSCAYNLYRGAVADPGFVPGCESVTQESALTESLARKGELDGYRWCALCSARRPIRSKHCRACDRCIARHDHHCPWLFNCVGIGNHRAFIYFVVSLVLGVMLFDRLTLQYFLEMYNSSDIPNSENSSSPSLDMGPLEYDPVLVLTAAWATLQLIWTLLVMTGQIFQISRQLTTLELSNLGKYGYMSGAADGRPPSDYNKPPPQSRIKKLSSCMLRLVGLDLYTHGGGARALQQQATASTSSSSASSFSNNNPRNPFDRGIIQNCSDFWTDGRTLGVDYRHLYDIGEVEKSKSPI